MRKPRRQVRPQVEAMESRALLSTLAPLSTTDHLESRGSASAVAALATSHRVVDGVTEVGRPQQQFPRASVRILNETEKNLTIAVTASLWVGSDRKQSIGPLSIPFSSTQTFSFTTQPPPGNGWRIAIDVTARNRSPMIDQTLFPPPNKDGYYGQLYKITLFGTGFAVERVDTQRP